jgi:hypothetical protein
MVSDNNNVSIITKVSGKASAINVFRNYMLQHVEKKELILVHNGQTDDFDQWVFMSRFYPMTRVYQMNAGTSLGECLNYCIDRAIFDNVAIFDEMHLYESGYISQALDGLRSFPAQLTGKRTYYMRAEDETEDVLVNAGFESCMTDMVILPTFVFRRLLFEQIKFEHSDDDIDISFCKQCAKRNYGIYSTGAGCFKFCRNSVSKAGGQ